MVQAPDPRSVITPKAFRVHPPLLGIPLGDIPGVILDGAQRVPGQWEQIVAAEEVRIEKEARDLQVDAAAPAPTNPDQNST